MKIDDVKFGLDRMEDIQDGDVVYLDGGFSCTRMGVAMVHKDNKGLFFWCRNGRHYLEGQKDEEGYLTGIAKYNR